MSGAMNEFKFHRRDLFHDPYLRPTPALFLDRDGVLIEDMHHLADPQRVRLCFGAKHIVHLAKEYRWPIIIVTNQSGISRGLFSWQSYYRVTDRMLELLGDKNSIAAIYANGFGPTATECYWRKPNPGMILQAASDLNIDLSQSILVGDRITDIQAGFNAGIRSLFHVLSGHGFHERKMVNRFAADLWAKEADVEVLSLSSLISFPFERLTY